MTTAIKIPTGKIGLKAVAGLLLALGLFAIEVGAQPGLAGKVPPQLPPQASDKAKEVVAAQTAPTVSLTAPAGGVLYTAPATVPLVASATVSSSGKFIAQVEFFSGATLIGTASSAPYAFTWAPVAAGAYSLTARATDNLGMSATSDAVAITVNAPPTVSLTSPGDATVFNAPATILLTAAAADPDGAIAQVEFYNGTNLIAALTAPPYSINWLQVPQGSYSLSARVTDNLGATTTSTAVTVTVNSALAQIYYIHTDHLNTPRAIYDQQQRLVWRWDQTDPFGGNPPNENPSGLGNFTCNLRLPGQYFDKETNLHYNYFRDYDPGIGRYVQSDPLGLMGGLNTFGYAGGTPMFRFDVFGLRDVVVAVWTRLVTDNSVGHVFVGELTGDTLLSQFPTPHGRHGENKTLNWYQTLSMEGRQPDAIYKVFVPDDARFDSTAKELRGRPFWDWQPVGYARETNCAHAAYDAFSAGGVNVPKPRFLPWSPDDFFDGMELLVQSGIAKRLPVVPWKRK